MGPLQSVFYYRTNWILDILRHFREKCNAQGQAHTVPKSRICNILRVIVRHEFCHDFELFCHDFASICHGFTFQFVMVSICREFASIVYHCFELKVLWYACRSVPRHPALKIIREHP